jgi:hypothetical protein
MKIQKKLLIVCSAGLLFFGCQKQPETVFIEVETLRPSSIYKQEDVYAYSRSFKNENEEMASSYLKKARELETQNLQQAIFNAKRAITLYPNSDNYKYLASLLNKARQYEELAKLYNLLVTKTDIRTVNGNEEVFIFGEPDEEEYYELLAARYLNDKEMSPYLVDQAEVNGFSKAGLKKRFLADSRIKLVAGTEAYKNAMLAFMTEAEMEAFTRSEANFRNILASIKDSGSVFTIDEKTVQAFDYHNSADEYYDDMRYSFANFFIYYLEEKQQNPDRWQTYNLNRKIRVSDSIQAILYAIDTSATACPKDMRHIYHRLVTYNRKGKIIQSKVVALQSGEQVSTADFSGNSFTVSEFHRTWKKPYNKEEFDNYLLKTEFTGKRTFEISGDGRIIEQEIKASAESLPESAG